MPAPKPLRVLQILPALNAGGVERGTLDFARTLVQLGHESFVVSNGGTMVAELEAAGTTHLTRPVHRKSLISYAQVRPMRRLLRELNPDIVHVRSRMPAWITWLAWRKLPASQRPGLVSTFHGLYSVTPYSAIMAKGERLIAISDCVHEYVLANYQVDPNKVTRIYRGLDPSRFQESAESAAEQALLLREFPQFKNQHLILMPGRLSRWKGQLDFLKLMAQLAPLEPQCHGVILGAAEADKAHYQQELLQLRDQLGLQDRVTLVGHRTDIQAFYRLARVCCHLSSKPEPFGRTVPEALACGCPVVAYNRGGAAESLQQSFPAGLVEPGNLEQCANRIRQLLTEKPSVSLPAAFFLQHQVAATLDVYQELLVAKACH